jgi:hypothetical protein
MEVLRAVRRAAGDSFQGNPLVSDTGELLYEFPSFQTSAAKRAKKPGVEGGFLVEDSWKFSLATKGQQVAAAALGLLNLAGVTFLSSLLRDPRVLMAAAQSGSAAVSLAASALPLLQVGHRWPFVFHVQGQREARTIARGTHNTEAAAHSGVDFTFSSKESLQLLGGVDTVAAPLLQPYRKLSSSSIHAHVREDSTDMCSTVGCKSAGVRGAVLRHSGGALGVELTHQRRHRIAQRRPRAAGADSRRPFPRAGPQARGGAPCEEARKGDRGRGRGVRLVQGAQRAHQ